MSLESFFGIEDGESQGSAEAAEKFREQMRKNAKAIKAMSGHQQQQKQKEDILARLLVKLITDASKSDLVFLIVKLLKENVPGAFILAIVSISDPQLSQDLITAFQKLKITGSMPQHFNSEEKLPALKTMPEEIRQNLNAWGDSILKAGLMRPGATLASVLTPDSKLKSIVLDLIDYALAQYFLRKGLTFEKTQVKKFALLSVQSVLIKLREKSQEMTDAQIIETPLDPEHQESAASASH